MLSRHAFACFACGALAACSSEKSVPAAPQPLVDKGPRLLALAGPPEINGANGIRFDSDGTLYVGSVNDGTLYRLDPETGEILEKLVADMGIQAPDDLTIAPDGTLYVVNIAQGNIVALKDGAYNVVASPGPGVDGVALSPDGMLIVGKDFLGDGLFEVDPAGVVPTRTVNAQPGWINAMAFSPDGTLYAPVWQKQYVARVDLAAGTVTQFSSEFAGTAGAVRFDSQGNLYAVDGGVGDVHRIDLTSGELTTIAHYGLPLDNLAFDADDRLFVSSYGDGSVNEVLADGSLRVVKAGGLFAPVALAVSSDKAESVYVGDRYGVRDFDGPKAVLRGGFGQGLALPATRVAPIALKTAGDRILALGPASVEQWDRSTGDVLSSLPIEGGEDVVEFAGSVVVSQPLAGSVVTLSDSGTTPLVQGLGDPAGLAVSKQDLFVTIYSTGEVLQIVEGGATLDSPRVVASDLASPEGIAVLPDGNLVVVETGTGDVINVNRKTGKKTTIEPALSPGAATDTPATLGTLNAVGVGASGHVYVLSPVDRTVHRIRL
jgi:sugar lactone lactonase YvrE